MGDLNKIVYFKTESNKNLFIKYDGAFIVNPEPEPIVVPNLDLSHEFGIGPGGSGDDTYCGWYIFAIDADTGEDYELKQEEWDVQITLTNTQGEMYQLTENDYRFGDWNNYLNNVITVFFPSRKFEHPYSTYQMEAKLISKIDSSKVFTSSGEPIQITENFTMQSSKSSLFYAQPEYNDDESSCLVKVTTEFNLCNILGDWRFELRPTNGDIIQITDFVVSEDGENRVNYGIKDFTFGPYTFENNGYNEFQLYMISPNENEYIIDISYTEIECKDVTPYEIQFNDYDEDELTVTKHYEILNSQGEVIEDMSQYTMKFTCDLDEDVIDVTESSGEITFYKSEQTQFIRLHIYKDDEEILSEVSEVTSFTIPTIDEYVYEFDENGGTQQVDLFQDTSFAQIIFGYNNTQN